MSGPLKSFYKVAILVDWENIRFRLFDAKVLKSKGITDDLIINYNRCPQKIIQYIRSFIDLENEELFRIYFYTCVFPDTISVRGKKLTIYNQKDKDELERLHKGYERKYQLSKALVNAVAKEDNVQVRLGNLGPRIYGNRLDFEQKQVDMLIGIDVATLAYKRLVDRIILFSYDTDLLPAILLAKEHGVQIVLPALEDVLEDLPQKLVEEADFVRKKNYVKIVNSWKS